MEKIRAVEHKKLKGLLTEYEQKALEGAKTLGWFNPERDFWCYKGVSEGELFVRRGYFVATRLYEKGYFEHRLVGEYPSLWFEFRSLESPNDHR